ncbi:hypothetical protein JL722_595 [Aureococcus anophagefferens]|nr:hypothetical protein JL722_595 [Aureococcus anophagefferens]
MEINRLVLPQRDGLGDTSETTAAKGRARFRYLEETSSVRDPREAGMERYASGLGRDTLSLVRSCEVGYETTDPSALSKGDASDDEDDNDSADSDDEKPPPAGAPVSHVDAEGHGRGAEDLTAEEKQTNLMMDMDWDTTQWSLREIEAASKLVGVAERTRHEVCGKKGEGITGLVCIARLHGDDEKRCKALRILLLVASVPLLARCVLHGNATGLCVSLLNVREPLKVRRLALDVLQAASLSVLTCCRQPATAPASPVPEKAARPGDRGDEAFHEPCGEVDAVRELARPGWLAVVLELLNGRDEALFLGAVRFCQRCAASCEGAMRHVLKEVLAFGGRPLERAIVGGLASGPNRGGRGALAGCARS